jgi:oxygen-independent coproporphyrinogen-3 oxidase
MEQLMSAVSSSKLDGDVALAEKYACQGPRYTSYPTALQFQPDFSRQALERELTTRRADSHAPLSLYVHIPFCNDICYYCACNKIVTRDRARAREYLDMLKRDIEMQSRRYGNTRPIRQLHWGGGSPTWLDDAEMTELMHELASHFHLLDQGEREYAIEVDPRTVDANRIALLRGLGFNRLSLGIQDFDPLVQRAVNRIQPLQQVQALVKDIRGHGFRSLSFDLIYGLPYQDQHTMVITLQRVIELQPDRIACYNYAHLPERFSSQRSIDRLSLPSATEKLALQELISGTLTSAGYHHIGLDHYVLPGDDLALAQRQGRLQRNFQGYSVQMADDLVGLGVSAISQVGNFYLQNETNIDAYYAHLQQGESPLWRGLEVSAEDHLRRHVIMQLICNLYLDFSDCETRFDIDFATHFSAELSTLQGMSDDGLLCIEDGAIRVEELGRPFLRNICMIFDQFLAIESQGPQKPRYSATL